MSISIDYLPLASIVGSVLAIFLYAEWEGRIRPMLIPSAEIEQLADQLVETHGDRAEEMAFIEEERAWHYSQAFEQGKWRRVRKELALRSGL